MNNKRSRPKKFLGPLFIVGMPRSGTKLLRGLLNEHPNVGIPDVETEFLPYWVNYWSRFGNLSYYSNFKRFYHIMMNVPYFIFMREKNCLINVLDWYDNCKGYTPSAVFEALIRHDTKIHFGTEKIWGDKSPSYISHLPLLKKLFPDARFIHVVRDVRDYCISINQAWGKNKIRAAQSWVNRLEKVHTNIRKFSDDYLEVRYEDLLDQTSSELNRICAFLELAYTSSMLSLSKTTENIGQTKGKKEVINSNKDKYFSLMTLKERKKIEMIAINVLETFKYEVNPISNRRKVSKMKMLLYQILDGINLYRYEIRERGLLGAATFHLKYFVTSGNRYKSG